jgi:hypothetical protein
LRLIDHTGRPRLNDVHRGCGAAPARAIVRELEGLGSWNGAGKRRIDEVCVAARVRPGWVLNLEATV